MPAADLAQAVKPFLDAKGYALPSDDGWLPRMVVTLQERAKTLVELVEMAHFYFGDDGGDRSRRQPPST